jgi:hypothetical protein
VKVFVPMVSERDLQGVPSLRTIVTSLEVAKALLDAEMTRAKQPPLEWRDEFGGAIAHRGGLVYEVVPAEAQL